MKQYVITYILWSEKRIWYNSTMTSEEFLNFLGYYKKTKFDITDAETLLSLMWN